MDLNEATKQHTHAVCESAHAGDGWLVEDDESVNDSARDVIAAMKAKHGTAWLGIINRYPEVAAPWMWEWDGKPVFTFHASFVAPAYDAELVKLLTDRDEAPYTGTKADAEWIKRIFDRIEAIGGHHLLWS